MEALGSSSGCDNICWFDLLPTGYRSEANDDAIWPGTANVQKYIGLLEENLSDGRFLFILSWGPIKYF